MVLKSLVRRAIRKKVHLKKGFPGGSDGKESARNAGDLGSIPGLGRSLPAMWETWVRSLGWEDPLEKGMAMHFSILAWRIPTDRGAWQGTVHGVAESDRTERLGTAHLKKVPSVGGKVGKKTTQKSCCVVLKPAAHWNLAGLSEILTPEPFPEFLM